MQDGFLVSSIAEFVFHSPDVRGLREEEDSEDRMLRCSELRKSEKVQLQPSAILFYCTGLVVLLVLRNTSVAYGRVTRVYTRVLFKGALVSCLWLEREHRPFVVEIQSVSCVLFLYIFVALCTFLIPRQV